MTEIKINAGYQDEEIYVDVEDALTFLLRERYDKRPKEDEELSFVDWLDEEALI